MRNAMSTVSMVGCEPATIIGTESTDSMVTKDRTSADQQRLRDLRQHDLDQHAQPRGAEIARRLDRRAVDRRHGAGEHQRDERHLLPDEGDDDAAPVEQARRLQRLEHAERDERVVHQPVLGEERAHALRRDDEGDEQRPAIERRAAIATSHGVSPSVSAPAIAIETSADQQRRE